MVASLLLKVVQSAEDKKPFCAAPACFTCMVVPLPTTAFVPPVIVNMEELASVRLPSSTSSER